MSTVEPFTVAVSDAAIADLHHRLDRTVLPPPLPGAEWRAGPGPAFMARVLNRLRDGFDWRAFETRLNAWPQFTTTIDGQTLHFLHVRSPRANAVPLLLIHGWPSSVVEFLGLIQPLTEPADKDAAAFDLVIPSLPGFGFSGAVHDSGWTNGRIAHALLSLMERLGYRRFGIQGGDAGAMIGPDIGRIAPERIIGIHVNAATMGFIPLGPVAEADIATFSDAEKGRLARLQRFMAEHFAFNMVQSTRPQALAYALADSPAGWLAWMSELYTSFGDRPEAIDLDAFLATALIYWFTGTGASSTYLYYENAHDPAAWAPKANAGVPTAVAVFKYDEVPIRRYGESANTIVRWTEYPEVEAGHFAALEAPDVLAADVGRFFSTLAGGAG